MDDLLKTHYLLLVILDYSGRVLLRQDRLRRLLDSLLPNQKPWPFG